MRKKKRHNYKPSGAVYYETATHKNQTCIGEYCDEEDGDDEEDEDNS